MKYWKLIKAEHMFLIYQGWAYVSDFHNLVIWHIFFLYCLHKCTIQKVTQPLPKSDPQRRSLFWCRLQSFFWDPICPQNYFNIFGHLLDRALDFYCFSSCQGAFFICFAAVSVSLCEREKRWKGQKEIKKKFVRHSLSLEILFEDDVNF